MTIVTEPMTAQRARAFADVAVDVVGDYYGLDAAVAVNPLLPRLSEGFFSAATVGAPALGATGSVGEDGFRSLLSEGRITRADLAAALLRARGARGDNTHLNPSADSDDGLVDAFLQASNLSSEAPAEDDPRSGEVDERVSRWARSWFAAEEAAWSVRRGEGYYRDWRQLSLVDPTLSAAARRRLGDLPETPADVLVRHLDERDVDDSEAIDLCARHLARTPGWTAALRRRTTTHRDIDAVEALAVRCALTSILDAPDPQPRAVSTLATERLMIWQEAYESAVHDGILQSLGGGAPGPTAGAESAHLVFCIDPRSEGMRRHVETLGPYGTSGFAGFFGVAARVSPLGASTGDDSCPVLLTPRHHIAERPRPGFAPQAGRMLEHLRSVVQWDGAARAPERSVGSALGWAEISGWILGPWAAVRSAAPGAFGERRRPDEAPDSVPSLFDIDSAMTPDEQLATADTILRTMGMTTNFAPLLVLVGHGATTTNSPFRTALDCGACGGHRGGANARLAAAILNSPAVRAGLADRGITIPDTTHVVAGEHDTVTDRVVIHDRSLVPNALRESLRQLEIDLGWAGRALRRERLVELPGGRRAGAEAEVARRAADWAQVYPEWGLARNAAIVIGPRRWTQGVDLARRVFLHSYEPDTDVDGSALTTILTAPLVVAHWINAQYYFSTVAPEVLGAGTKTVHNLMGGLGVLGGASGDLRIGLPHQSVLTREGLHHEPLRLLAIVDAPMDRVDAVIARHDVVRELVHGEWVRLVVPAPGGGWLLRTDDGWEPWISRTPPFPTKQKETV